MLVNPGDSPERLRPNPASGSLGEWLGVRVNQETSALARELRGCPRNDTFVSDSRDARSPLFT